MTRALKVAAKAYGLERLGFTENDLGTHSIRSGAAMTVYLDEVLVYNIMIIGRWSSDAFLRYIRKQVEHFSHKILCQMIKNQHFTHVPPSRSKSNLDPLQQNHRDNAQTRQNGGRVAGKIARTLPATTMW